MTFHLSRDFSPFDSFRISRKKVIGFLKEKRQSLPEREQVGLKNVQGNNNLDDWGKYPELTRTKKKPSEKDMMSESPGHQKTPKSQRSISMPAYTMVEWKIEITLASNSSMSDAGE